MVRVKHILLVYFINFCIVDSSSQVCQYVSKNYYGKKIFDFGCLSDYSSSNLWNYLTNSQPKQSLWEKYKSATECFTWEVFEEPVETSDHIKLPFESVINGVEFIVYDFTRFYVDYVSKLFNTVRKWKLLKYFINPATIFALAMYIFHKKIFLPLLRNIQKEIELNEEYPEIDSTPEEVKGDQLPTNTEFED